MPVYNPNIPQPTDLVSQSQSQILGNFGSLEYVPNGIIQFPDNMGIPAQNALTQIFSQTSALTGFLELFIQRPTDSTEIPTPVEFTSYGVKSISYTITTGGPVAGLHGWTRFPSGVLLKFGYVGGIPFNTNENVTYPTDSSIPAFSSVLIGGVRAPVSILAIPSSFTLNTDPLANINVIGNTTTTFNAYATPRYPGAAVGASVPFYWLAIGW